MTYLADIVKSKELMINLASRQIKGQFKRTFFGQLWSLANPIALMLVYTFVFSFVFKINPGTGQPSGLDSFPLWLLCGLLPWTFFARAVSVGTSSLTNNEGLIQKVYFPRLVLPISDISATAYNWCFEMAVLSLALVLVGSPLVLNLPALVLAMFLLTVFASGVALLLSVANAYFRDTEYLLSVGLQLLIYLSPIVYPIAFVIEKSKELGPLIPGTEITLEGIYMLNPMTDFILLFREILYDGAIQNPELFLYVIFWSFGFLSLGAWLYSKVDSKLAEIL